MKIRPVVASLKGLFFGRFFKRTLVSRYLVWLDPYGRPVLYHGPIPERIPEYTPEQIQDALDCARCEGFVARLQSDLASAYPRKEEWHRNWREPSEAEVWQALEDAHAERVSANDAAEYEAREIARLCA